MFGKLYTVTLLAAVVLTAVTRVEDTVEYSPWCSCKVSVQFTVLLPRRAPCKRLHQKYENKRLCLGLLLVLAGDVELNPGPNAEVNISHSNNGNGAMTLRNTEDATEGRCALCNMAPESLMLRSRAITDTVSKCNIIDCTSVAHYRCIAGEKEGQVTKWTCGRHFKDNENHELERTSPLHRSPSIGSADSLAQPPNTELELTRQAEDIERSSRHNRTSQHHSEPLSSVEPEPVPGPSFMSVSLMDVMEALRLTQLKLDQVSEDVADLKQVIRTVLPENGGRPTTASPPPPSPAAPDGSTIEDRRTGLDRPSRQNDNTITCSSPFGKPDLLIIGDSNVSRLETSTGSSCVSFRSTPGANIEQLEREINDESDKFTASTIALHVGTNDLSRKGSEEIAMNIVRIAKLTKARSGTRQVLICSVTPRRDLGSFIFSRSESVNNRLRSLCTNMPGVRFVDLREQLDRCPFTGLSRDALHYNRAGASRVLNGIVHTALSGSFLAKK